ncbi:MAG TPA: hypothetical protein VI793_02340 [Anaerolineales bacterium]|nr:hypothetical protein [Anaerolineales bacterium]
MKLTVLGGSGIATPELITMLARAQERPALDVVLHGRTADKLQIVGGVCARLAQEAVAPLAVSFTTDLDSALEGADFVLNQIRVGGYAARAFDEMFPRELGLPGEETVGPGGFSLTARTIPVVLDDCRAIERRAPRAILINLTNPASLIQYAISRYASVNSLGVCDAPVTMSQLVSAALGAPLAELEIDYLGMHHFGWITGVRQAGRDRMLEVLARADWLAEKLSVDAEVIRAVGAVPGTYFKYYFHPDRMLAAQQGKAPRAESLLALESELLAAYQAGQPEAVTRRNAHWFEEIVVPVLLALMTDSRAAFFLNVPNKGALNFMPEEAIVEVPVRVGRSGAGPDGPVGKAPDAVRALLQMNAAYETLAVEAIVERDRAKALRALLLNPLIRTADQAKGTLEQVWRNVMP